MGGGIFHKNKAAKVFKIISTTFKNTRPLICMSTENEIAKCVIFIRKVQTRVSDINNLCSYSSVLLSFLIHTQV